MLKILSIKVSCLLLLALVFKAAVLEAAPVYPVKILESRPHAAECYTQGLFFWAGDLYESCGRYAGSSINRWSFPAGRTGSRLQKRALPEKYFAEGAAAVNNEIYLLTWREGTVFVLQAETLMFLREFSYPGEGWGLTWDGRRLWRSDGSSSLYPHRPEDFASASEPLVVRDRERNLEIARLNELEWDESTGLILANIYGEDLVAAIDPADGQVRFWLDARPVRASAFKDGLSDSAETLDIVLNGLALADDGLWLTGKLWPIMYKIAWPPAGKP